MAGCGGLRRYRRVRPLPHGRGSVTAVGDLEDHGAAFVSLIGFGALAVLVLFGAELIIEYRDFEFAGSDVDYDEIRNALIKDYAPATTQELMLVDQIAAGYWRTSQQAHVGRGRWTNQMPACLQLTGARNQNRGAFGGFVGLRG